MGVNGNRKINGDAVARRARILVALMTARSDGWLSWQQLAAIATDEGSAPSRATVYRIVAELERLGVVAIERRSPSLGGFRTREIFIGKPRISGKTKDEQPGNPPARPARVSGRFFNRERKGAMTV